MSRTLCVYSSEILYTDIFAEREKSDTLWKDLAADLTDIYKTWGEFSISEEAMGAINDWARSGGQPAPDHPKLLSYNTRRLHHLLKLCMVAALACDSELIITVDHFVEALDWLVELETFMPDIFKSMRTGGDAAAIEECYHYCFQQYMRRGNKHVPEQLMWAFLQDRVPAHNVARILEVMERAGLIKKEFMESGQGYKPMGKVQ